MQQRYPSARCDLEKIIAANMVDVANEIRCLELHHLVHLIQSQHHGAIDDLVLSAAELFYEPGVVKYGHSADVLLCWAGAPVIDLAIEFSFDGDCLYFRMLLGEDEAGVSLSYATFSASRLTAQEQPASVSKAFAMARLPLIGNRGPALHQAVRRDECQISRPGG